jgi:UDP-glucose 4-epimerase
MNKLKIGILGSNGFIAKALIEEFKKNQYLAELHLYYRRNFKKLSNYNSNVFEHQFELSNNNKDIPESLYEIEVLYFLISDSIPATSWEKPEKELTENLVPFINLIEKLRFGNLKKIIFTSSAGTIYGPTVNKIIEEGDKKPFSPHGIIKLTTEYFLEFFQKKYGINYTIFRISNVYGPGQNTNKGLGLINTILDKHIKNEEISIYGDGSSIRNYIYINDVAEILSLELKKELNSSKIINLASSYHLSVNELLILIESLTNKKLNIKQNNSRCADNPVVWIDNSKLIKTYPEFRNTSIKDGIKKTFIALKKG